MELSLDNTFRIGISNFPKFIPKSLDISLKIYEYLLFVFIFFSKKYLVNSLGQ